MNVRHFKSSEYELIKSWWVARNEPPPGPDEMPEESTFVLEKDGVPWISVSLFLTNTSICWVDNLIANPLLPGGEERKRAVVWLEEFIESSARVRGYKKLWCMAHKEPLAIRYNELGYEETCENIKTFVKEL